MKTLRLTNLDRVILPSVRATAFVRGDSFNFEDHIAEKLLSRTTHDVEDRQIPVWVEVTAAPAKKEPVKEPVKPEGENDNSDNKGDENKDTQPPAKPEADPAAKPAAKAAAKPAAKAPAKRPQRAAKPVTKPATE